MSANLSGKRIAFLAADGFEQIEFTRPWQEIKAAGAVVELVSLKAGEIQGMNHFDKADKFKVDRTVNDVSAGEYDGLVLPGGVANPDALRVNEDAVNFVKEFFAAGKTIAAICHGPWLLVEAGILKGRIITSWPSLKTDVINAGGSWMDEPVHVDNGLVTSRKPDDLDAFCEKAIQEFAKDITVRQAA